MSAKLKVGLILAITAAVAAAIGVFIWQPWRSPETPPLPTAEPFAIEQELYEGSQLKEIDAEQFNKLIEDKKSFVVIAHMDICPAETPLTTTAETLALNDGFTFYGLKTNAFKDTSLANSIKFLPSAAIFHNGELVTFLDAESDADIPYYQTAEGLKTWLKKYIKLPKE